VIVVCAVLGDTLLCTAISSVHDRYQARVTWLIPMAVLLLLCKRREPAPGEGKEKGFSKIWACPVCALKIPSCTPDAMHHLVPMGKAYVGQASVSAGDDLCERILAIPVNGRQNLGVLKGIAHI